MIEGGSKRVECMKSLSRRVGFIVNDTFQGHDHEIRRCGRMVAMINGEDQELRTQGGGVMIYWYIHSSIN